MTVTPEDLQTDLATGCLLAGYDGVICDLDGVVYRGARAVPGSVETLNEVVRCGIGLVFATNNASRPPQEVAEHLRDLGIAGSDWSVVTSSQSAAAYLEQQLRPDARVLAVGGPGVAAALARIGLLPVHASELDDRPASSIEAMVQGLGPGVTWRELAVIAHLARAGVPWVATNLDLSHPTEHGPAPGNGAMVAAVRTATRRVPHLTGKPDAALFDLARANLGTGRARTLVCGDRLDTDIAGGKRAGHDSLLVLSGSTSLQDLAFACEDQRPTYAVHTLQGILQPARPLRPATGEPVMLNPDGLPLVSADGDREERLRSVVAGAWGVLDDGGVLTRDAEAWAALGTAVSDLPCEPRTPDVPTPQMDQANL